MPMDLISESLLRSSEHAFYDHQGTGGGSAISILKEKIEFLKSLPTNEEGRNCLRLFQFIVNRNKQTSPTDENWNTRLILYIIAGLCFSAYVGVAVTVLIFDCSDESSGMSATDCAAVNVLFGMQMIFLISLLLTSRWMKNHLHKPNSPWVILDIPTAAKCYSVARRSLVLGFVVPFAIFLTVVIKSREFTSSVISISHAAILLAMFGPIFQLTSIQVSLMDAHCCAIMVENLIGEVKEEKLTFFEFKRVKEQIETFAKEAFFVYGLNVVAAVVISLLGVLVIYFSNYILVLLSVSSFVFVQAMYAGVLVYGFLEVNSKGKELTNILISKEWSREVDFNRANTFQASLYSPITYAFIPVFGFHWTYTNFYTAIGGLILSLVGTLVRKVITKTV